MTTRTQYSWLIMGMMLASAMMGHAQSQEPITDARLEPVTVYATRSARSSFEVPALTSIMQAEDTRSLLADDVAAFLAYLPGVDVTGGPRRKGQVVSIRGFDDEAILTSIDGRRQNFESTHDGRMYLNPTLLKRVEVVKGANSAMYGGGALGGVLAYETKTAADFLAPGQTNGYAISGGYRTGKEAYSTNITRFARADTWDVVTDVGLRDSDDIEQGDGNKLRTDEHLVSALIKLGTTFSDYHTVGLNSKIHRDNGIEPNNGQGLITRSNPLVRKRVRDDQLSLTYRYENPSDMVWQPRTHFYYNNTAVKETNLTGSSTGRSVSRALKTTGFTLDNQSQWQWPSGHTHIVSYGFEIYRDEQVGKSSSTGALAGVPNARALNYGFYLQDDISLTTTFGRFLVMPAIRFDSYSKNDELGNEQDETQFSPKVSLSYLPTDDIMVFGNWAQAFRAPNLSETFARGLHFPGGFPSLTCPRPAGSRAPFVIVPDNRFVPNVQLKPETVMTWEFGGGIKLGDARTIPGRAILKGSWFLSEGKDFITSNIDICAGETKNRNIAKAELTGWEVDITYVLDIVKVKLGGSYVEATNKNTGAYISNNLPLTLVADIGFDIRPLDMVAGWRGRFAKANNRRAPSDVATPGYGVNDIYLRWIPSQFGARKPVRLDVSITNLLDKAYQKRFSSLTEEGRSYNIGLALQW